MKSNSNPLDDLLVAPGIDGVIPAKPNTIVAESDDLETKTDKNCAGRKVVIANPKCVVEGADLSCIVGVSKGPHPPQSALIC